MEQNMKKQIYMWPSYWGKPVAHGSMGAVSCNNIYATRAGLEILNKGGNAFDAAVAVSLTLSVVAVSYTHLLYDWFKIAHGDEVSSELTGDVCGVV